MSLSTELRPEVLVAVGLEAVGLDEQRLRAQFQDELLAAGLTLPDSERDLVVSLCVSAYREDVVRAVHRPSGRA